MNPHGHPTARRGPAGPLGDGRDEPSGALPSVVGTPFNRKSRIRLVRRLRSTASAVVYEAVHELLGQPLVVKLPASDSPEDADALKQEVAALARLRHPNNVQIVDVGTLPYEGRESPFFAVEHLDGEPLSSLIRLHRRLPAQRAVRIALQVLMALEEAHSHGVVHGDIQPDKVLVGRPAGLFDHVKVIDYGAARRPSGAGGGAQTQSRATGLRLFGSPHYAAPELAGGGAPTPLADLYSVGVILYECISGLKPFRGEDEPRAFSQLSHGAHVSLRELVPIDPRLAEVVERAMANVPSRRFSSARELMQALAALDQAAPAAFQNMELDAPQQRRSARDPVEEPPVSGGASGASEITSIRLRSVQQPTLWVLGDDPATAHPALRGALATLCSRYRIVVLDEATRRAARGELAEDRIDPPWVALFGEAHVLSADQLLAEFAGSAETSTALVSRQLDVEMLQRAIHAAGLKRQLCVPQEPETIVAVIDELVERAREVRQYFDWLRLGLRDARADVASISRGLSEG